MKWFKHDSDSNRDPKLEKVLMKYGAEGYALYWLCLELIAAPVDKANITFELEHDAEILAHRLKMDSVRVEEIVRYMVDIRLFEVSQTTQRITCMTMALRIENSIVKNPELKQLQKNISASRTIPDDPGIVGLDKTRLDLDTDKTNTCARETSTSDRFDAFWDVYPKKRNKKQCAAIWKNRKLDKMADMLIADVKRRVTDDPEWIEDGGQFIPLPSTYLNGDRWEDDIENPIRRLDAIPAYDGNRGY